MAYYPNVPPWKIPLGGRGDDQTGLQMNASAAVTRGGMKSRFQQIMLGASLLVVAYVLFLGSFLNEGQKTSVEASLTLKRSLAARIDAINPGKNTFSVTMRQTNDEPLSQSGVTAWTVYLPPGAKWDDDATSSYRACFSASSFADIPSKAIAVPCSSILSEQKEVIVEYVTLNPDQGRMVAKRIFGKAP